MFDLFTKLIGFTIPKSYIELEYGFIKHRKYFLGGLADMVLGLDPTIWYRDNHIFYITWHPITIVLKIYSSRRRIFNL